MTRKISSLKMFILLLTGIIVSGIISVMYLTKSINLEQFYNVGNLYDIASMDCRTAGENWQYNYGTKLTEIGAENAWHAFAIKSRQKEWNYLYLELENLSRPTGCEVHFYDGDGNVIYTMEHELQNGCNIFQLQEGEISVFHVIVKEPCTFHIQRIQFREQLQEFGWGEGLLVFGIVFACWLSVMLIYLFVMQRVRKAGNADKKTGRWMEKLQETYRYFLYQGAGLQQGLSSETISQLRRVLFLISILIVYIMFVSGWRWNTLIQRRMVFALGLCLLLIAFLSVEINRRAVNWKNPLMYAWIALWVMCMVSEFVSEKKIQNAGIFMFLCMAPLYMSWGSMKTPDHLLKDFLAALQWSFWAACFFCIFFRPHASGIRYMGIYKNPNSFAGYLVTVNIAFLIWMDENLNKAKLKMGTLCKNALALASIFGFLVLTESVTSLAVYMMQWLVFIWKQFPNEKTDAYQRHLRRFVFTFLLAFIFVGIPGKWCLDNLPRLLNTSITFRGDAYSAQTNPLSMVVHAAESQGSGVAERMLSKIRTGDWDALFSSRTDVWKNFIRHLNLFGHDGYLECLGQNLHAHNALLQMMHYYGVFVAVPYLVMLYYSVKYGVIVIFNKRRSGMNLFFLMAVVNYIIQGLAEDMATPFFYITWLTYFIALGGLVNQPQNRDMRG